MTDSNLELPTGGKSDAFAKKVKSSGGLFVPETKIVNPRTGEDVIQDFTGAETPEEAEKIIDTPAYLRKRNPPKGK